VFFSCRQNNKNYEFRTQILNLSVYNILIVWTNFQPLFLYGWLTLLLTYLLFYKWLFISRYTLNLLLSVWISFVIIKHYSWSYTVLPCDKLNNNIWTSPVCRFLFYIHIFFCFTSFYITGCFLMSRKNVKTKYSLLNYNL